MTTHEIFQISRGPGFADARKDGELSSEFNPSRHPRAAVTEVQIMKNILGFWAFCGIIIASRKGDFYGRKIF